MKIALFFALFSFAAFVNCNIEDTTKTELQRLAFKQSATIKQLRTELSRCVVEKFDLLDRLTDIYTQRPYPSLSSISSDASTSRSSSSVSFFGEPYSRSDSEEEQ